jgi:hypothetical protein
VPVRRTSWCSRLACLGLALSSSACSRCGSELEPPSASGKPSATASGHAIQPNLDVPSQPAAPPVTPNVPPQLVACGERDFYRITQSALEVFESAQELPPPQIRGSRIARQTTEVPIFEPLNVFSPAKKRVLVIAKGGLFRYELGQTGAQRYAQIEASRPLAAWPDPRRADSFRVRTVSDEDLKEYTLAGVPSGNGGSPSAPAKVTERVEDLPGFDTRLFTVLTDGTPLYSTPKGVVLRGHESRPIPLSELSGPATILFPDASPDRYWAAGASGHLALWDPKQGPSPMVTSRVPGVVIDAAA